MTAALLRKLAAALLVCISQTPPWRNSTAKDNFTEVIIIIFWTFFVQVLRNRCHSLLPVSVLSHLMLPVKPDRSPARTERSWARPAAGRDPAARGTCPLVMEGNRISELNRAFTFPPHICVLCATHGSGVYKGSELCRTYWVQWKTRKAKPARKSRGDR